MVVKGRNMSFTQIKPVSEATDKILELQGDCSDPHVDEAGRERLPWGAQSVLVGKANTADEPFLPAFCN